MAKKLVKIDPEYRYSIEADYAYDRHPDGDRWYYASLTVTRPDGGEETMTLSDDDSTESTLTWGTAMRAGLAPIDDDDYEGEDYSALIQSRFDLLESIQEQLTDTLASVTADYDDLRIGVEADAVLESAQEEGYVQLIEFSPRGFANEVDLIGVTADELETVEAWLDRLEGDNNARTTVYSVEQDADLIRVLLVYGLTEASNWNNPQHPPCGVTTIRPWAEFGFAHHDDE